MEGRTITANGLAEFKEHLVLEERSTATIQKYVRDVKAFSKYAQGGEIRKETVIAYKKYLQDIHPDLFGDAARIAKLLETGRADTLKEAINLAFEEDRKDAEEEARQIEAARREAILEQQAQETREHQQAMEQAAREHNAAMEREAREHNLAMQAAAAEQNRLSGEQNKIAREQNEFTSNDSHRCSHCKNRWGCARNIHNCGAFVSER